MRIRLFLTLRFLLFSAGIFFASSQAYAGANDLWLWFKGKDIDYFLEGKTVKDPLKRTVSPLSQTHNAKNFRLPIREYDKLPFDWTNYDDPASPVFMDEGGDYQMPRPLQIVLADPTPTNIEKYRRWQKRKAEASMMISQLIVEPTDEEKKFAQVRWRDVGLYYFYSTTCSACQAEHEVIEQIRNLGVQITPVQLDYQSNPPTIPRSLNYDENMKRGFEVSATPTFAIFGNGRNKRWEGYTSLDEFKSNALSLF